MANISELDLQNLRHLIAAHPLYTYTFHLHLQNTHAMGVRILVCSFPPVAEGLAPPPPEL